MKRMLIVAAIIPLLAVSYVKAEGYITGTKHNFSSMAWSGGEICKPCHTPHNAMDPQIAGTERLWNHKLTTASYKLHDGTSESVTTAVDKVSRLCLSCHDGTVALDSFGTKDMDGAGAGGSFIPEWAKIGTDLSNDHPVGTYAVYKEERQHSGHFTYNPIAGVKSAGLRFVNLGTTRTVTGRDGTPNVTVANEAIACTTCHNAHGAGNDKLLRMTNTGSKLCLTCHPK